MAAGYKPGAWPRNLPSKRSLFYKKAPQKIFAIFTRDGSASPGGKETKVFAELFSKSDHLLFKLLFGGVSLQHEVLGKCP